MTALPPVPSHFLTPSPSVKIPVWEYQSSPPAAMKLGKLLYLGSQLRALRDLGLVIFLSGPVADSAVKLTLFPSYLPVATLASISS